MAEKRYNPCWPETVIFWGAGATAALGFPTTDDIAKALLDLTKEDIHNIDHFKKWEDNDRESFQNLLEKIGGKDKTKDDQHSSSLSDIYDWDALKMMIQVCPGAESESIRATDLFNLIDLHINTNHGFHSSNDQNQSVFIYPERFLPARNALKLIIQTMMFVAWKNAVHKKQKELNQYYSFCIELSKLMQQEAVELERRGHDLSERSFFLFSHAFISLNWDPALMWLKHNAHDELNHASNVPYLGNPPGQLQLMDDMIHFQGVRQVDANDPWVLYPCNEAVVQRVNRESTSSSRKLRVCRYYYPHGCLSWRECPNCGKLMAALGNEWDKLSPTLIPPPPLSSFAHSGMDDWKGYWRSDDEKEAEESGKPDTLQCPFCSELTDTRHTPLVMQSSMKGDHPPYVEEIQRDMRVLLENAKHIVFMGYSLPMDDFIYRAILSARRNCENPAKCSIVNFQEGKGNEWYKDNDLENLLKSKPTGDDGLPRNWVETVNQASALFRKENIRLNLAGIPNIFLDGTKSSKERVKDILYPDWAFDGKTIAELREKYLKTNPSS